MRTTVLIPAHNEALYIGATLDSLPADLVEPIVAVNATSDETAEIARSFGARVHEYEQAGKLPAIQATLKRMGRQALDPILLLDGDTRPVFPRAWHSSMTRVLQPDTTTPWVAAGPAWFIRNDSAKNSSQVSANLRSLQRLVHGLTTSHDSQQTQQGAYYGPNQSMKLASTQALEAVLGLPHIWPKEDVAMVDAITGQNGKYKLMVDPRAMALTPESIAYLPLIDYIKRPESIGREIEERYLRNAPEGSISYDEWLKDRSD